MKAKSASASPFKLVATDRRPAAWPAATRSDTPGSRIGDTPRATQSRTWSLVSTPTTICPSRRRPAAVTIPTCPSPMTRIRIHLHLRVRSVVTRRQKAHTPQRGGKSAGSFTLGGSEHLPDNVDDLPRGRLDQNPLPVDVGKVVIRSRDIIGRRRRG